MGGMRIPGSVKGRHYGGHAGPQAGAYSALEPFSVKAELITNLIIEVTRKSLYITHKCGQFTSHFKRHTFLPPSIIF
jgi:hypothetical protein